MYSHLKFLLITTIGCVLSTGIVILLIIRVINSAPSNRVIIVTDAGLDDSQALEQLLSADARRHIKIEAIVCSRGSTDVDSAAAIVIRLLEVENRRDIDVHKGFYNNILPNNNGSVEFKSDNQYIFNEEIGPTAIARLASTYSGEISIISLAPLTDVALAFRLFENVASKLKAIYVSAGRNNFNFIKDPEATYVVLREKTELILLQAETCNEHGVSLEFEGAVWSMEMLPYDYCDALLTASFLHPEIVLTSSFAHGVIDLHESRGKLVLDYDVCDSQVCTLRSVESLDLNKLKTIFNQPFDKLGYNYIIN